MVVGLGLFIEHFRGDLDKFVLIGGTACSVCFEQQGLEFRATKDLDIVLLIDVLDARFVERLWDFIRAAGYEIKERNDGTPELFRFSKPAVTGYPVQLEFFCRASPAMKPCAFVVGWISSQKR